MKLQTPMCDWEYFCIIIHDIFKLCDLINTKNIWWNNPIFQDFKLLATNKLLEHVKHPTVLKINSWVAKVGPVSFVNNHVCSVPTLVTYSSYLPIRISDQKHQVVSFDSDWMNILSPLKIFLEQRGHLLFYFQSSW